MSSSHRVTTYLQKELRKRKELLNVHVFSFKCYEVLYFERYVSLECHCLDINKFINYHFFFLFKGNLTGVDHKKVHYIRINNNIAIHKKCNHDSYTLISYSSCILKRLTFFCGVKCIQFISS